MSTSNATVWVAIASSAGTAIGAAYAAYKNKQKNQKAEVMKNSLRPPPLKPAPVDRVHVAILVEQASRIVEMLLEIKRDIAANEVSRDALMKIGEAMDMLYQRSGKSDKMNIHLHREASRLLKQINEKLGKKNE